MLPSNDTPVVPVCVLPGVSARKVDRFWARVDRTPGQGPRGKCWGWIGPRNSDGYGTVKLNGKSEKAHRVAWMLANGPIPENTPHILHSCDWPPCCNPDCLWAGTHAENMQDMIAKGRGNKATGDRHGTHTHPERVARGDRHSSRTHPERLPRGEDHYFRRHPERLPHGEAHFRATASDATVEEARSLYATGQWSQQAIADKLGVAQTTISGWVLRKTRR